MPNKREYLEYLTEWLSPLGEITSRSMFGGNAFYSNGVVFALVAGNLIYLKVDDLTRPRFEALNLKPFQPFADNPGTMQYFPPPPEFFEDPDAMKAWARPAIEAGKRAQAKKPRKKRTGKG